MDRNLRFLRSDLADVIAIKRAIDAARGYRGITEKAFIDLVEYEEIQNNEIVKKTMTLNIYNNIFNDENTKMLTSSIRKGLLKALQKVDDEQYTFMNLAMRNMFFVFKQAIQLSLFIALLLM